MGRRSGSAFAPPLSTGLYAVLPAIGTVPAGTEYWATDLNSGTLFRSIGGAWVNVSGSKVLGSTLLATNFTMTTAATPEDVPAFTVPFTYDGRPVKFRCFCPFVSQDQAASKLITLRLQRSTDSANQANGYATTDAVANSVNEILIETGWLTAWPSDSAAFAIGTTYNVKANLTTGASAKAKISGGTAVAVLEVVTG